MFFFIVKRVFFVHVFMIFLICTRGPKGTSMISGYSEFFNGHSPGSPIINIKYIFCIGNSIISSVITDKQARVSF